MQRLTVIAIGVLAAGVLLYFYATRLPVADTRMGLEIMVAIELGLALLVATNTAATALTREKEGGTLEILLLTPLVSREILWGKIVGLVLFTAPMLVIPLLSLLMFVLYDLIHGTKDPVVHAEVLLTMPLLMIGFSSAACMLGLFWSIAKRKTVQAVVFSVGCLLAACLFSSAGLFCAGSTPEGAAALMPAGPITAVMVAVNPAQWLGYSSSVTPAQLDQCRLISAIASLISALVWFVVGKFAHGSMVKQFDMVIRKQTM